MQSSTSDAERFAPARSWMMKSTMNICFPFLTTRWAMAFALLAGAALTQAQAPKPFQGTITAINGSTDRKSVV